MARKDRQRYLQKRNAKLQKKKRVQLRRERQVDSTSAPAPYVGRKYRTEKFVPITLATETGIHFAAVMFEGKLTDAEVAEALTEIIGVIRCTGVDAVLAWGRAEASAAAPSVVAWNIAMKWVEYSERQELCSRDALIGVLRSILGSIEARTSPARPRGYLQFLRGFLGKLGVWVESLTPEQVDARFGHEIGQSLEWDKALDDQEHDEDQDDDEDDLISIALDWDETGEPHFAEEFQEEVEYRVHAGRGREVVDICRQLLGRVAKPHVAHQIAHVVGRIEQQLSIP